MSNGNPNQVEFQEVPGGLVAILRDGIQMVIQDHSRGRLRLETYQPIPDAKPEDQPLPAPVQVGDIQDSRFRAALAKTIQTHFGAEQVPNIVADIDRVASALYQPIAGGKTPQDMLEDAKPSMAERIVGYARAGGAFWHTPEEEAFATVEKDGHLENHKVNTPRFKRWLDYEFWRREEERMREQAIAQAGDLYEEPQANRLPAMPRDQILGDARRQLESLALFRGEEHEIYMRVAEHDGKLYIDLCDEQWRAVEVSKGGWKVLTSDEVPVKFMRKPNMRPLPEPVGGASIEILRPLLNVGDGEEGERNWRLVCAWLSHSLTPFGPYTVLTLLGNQGSAKSTTQRLLRSIIDPNKSPVRRRPREDRDLYVAATNGWVVSLDNMSNVPDWMSDALCMLSTGGGLSIRKNYSDDEEFLMDARRPIVINGIGDVVTRPDLLDRAVLVTLPSVGGRAIDEKKLDAKLDEIAPWILGALLDAAVVGLNKLPEVVIESPGRMVDFERWSVATEEALEGEPGSFMKAYDATRADAVDTALENHPIAGPLWKFSEGFVGESNAWLGTATDLLNALNDRVEDEDRRQPDWPRQANQLSAQLNRLAPAFHSVGVYIKRHRKHGGLREIQLYSIPRGR
jgi:hypothetical protein